MQISENGLSLIKQSEGFSSTVYNDNGRPAIGYGHDLLPGDSFPDGVTEAGATALLLADCEHVQAWMGSSLLIPSTCTQGQWDALCDFGFNLGVGSMDEMLRHGWDQVPVQLPRWNHVNGVVSAGLTARREAELRLFTS